MDAQELRNLQEAYLEVIKEYEYPYDRAQRIRAQTSSSSAYDRAQRNRAQTSSSSAYDRAQTNRADAYGRAQKKKKQRTQQEQIDLYDIILSHLLDEGYAETPEAAEAIMVNMSEEWRESIIG